MVFVKTPMPDHPLLARVPPLEMPPLAPLDPQATVAAPPVVSTNVAASAMASLAKAQEETFYTTDEDGWGPQSDEEKPEGGEEAEGKNWTGAEEDHYRD